MKYHKFSPIPPSGAVIGHRGIAKHAPENTLSSFKLAAKQKVDWIEFDIRLTKDNSLVVFHDDTLERTTNGSGWVHEHTLKELAMLDAGAWFSPAFRGEPIPVFEEVLPELFKLSLYLNIELKIPPRVDETHENRLCEQVITLLSSSWPSLQAWPLISSFHWPLLEKIRHALPEVPLGFLSETCEAATIKMVANTPNAALHCDYQNLSEEMLNLCEQASVPVLAYTVNQPEIAKKLINAGIFGLFSDDPQHLRA